MMTKDEKRILYWERNGILTWFRNNDYIVNKIVLGEWEKTDARYIEYLEKRAEKRQRYDEITALIGE